MATFPSTTTKILTVDSSSLFLSSFNSHLTQSPQTLIPQSLSLLSQNSLLPPIPPNFPQTKLIPNTKFIVDGFKCAGNFSVSYFLSHFHSDHYTGLNPNWSKGIIFCSEITSKLLIQTLKISHLFVVSLELNDTVEIDGCEVTLIDANHCPGAVQFLFKMNSERYIHTGDFRFNDSMKKDGNLSNFLGCDGVFLDTTYCNPKYVFPSQEESVEYIVSTIERLRDHNEGLEGVLILIATYVVGKERILLEISQQLNCLLHVDHRKMEILSVLGFGDANVFTEDALASSVHVIDCNVLGETWPYFRPNFVKMKDIMLERGYSKAVGFVSTGWMYETKNKGFAMRAKDELEIHLVPYSEHSSYEELREYVRFLRPKRVIPIVGVCVEKLDGKNLLASRKHFHGLVDGAANKQDFLMAFSKKTDGADNMDGNDMAIRICQLEDVVEEDNLVQNETLSEDLSTEEMEEAERELHGCLPSWVTQDQILGLLKSSNGDIVQAVSEFFEHETEFYEKADVHVLSATDPGSQKSSQNIFTSPAMKSSQESQKCGTKLLDLSKKSTGLDLATAKSSLPKKRGSRTGNKLKKKGKTSTSDSSGSKQSTITKFFGKAISSWDQFCTQ